jgi:hypothetical protein
MIHRVRGSFFIASILQIYLKLSFEKMIHRVRGSFITASILQIYLKLSFEKNDPQGAGSIFYGKHPADQPCRHA